MTSSCVGGWSSRQAGPGPGRQQVRPIGRGCLCEERQGRVYRGGAIALYRPRVIGVLRGL